MSLLKAEPPAPVSSLPELFAIAHALEEEAASRYGTLAEEMAALGLHRVASVFRNLVEEEVGHAHRVEEWARGTSGTFPDHHLMRWRPPETFDEEEARQIALSRLASAYRALSMAVRNEERAFAFWTYVAARAEVDDVRHAAERMAGEELRHAALLRRERRRAWREDKPPVGLPPLARAAVAERRLAGLLRELSEGDSGQSHGTEWGRLAVQAEDAAARAETLDNGDSDVAALTGHVAREPLAEVRRLAEAAAEAWIDAADVTREDAVLGPVQEFAQRAVARVAALGQAIDLHDANHPRLRSFIDDPRAGSQTEFPEREKHKKRRS